MLTLQDVIAIRKIPAEIVDYHTPLPTVELAAQAAGVPHNVIVKTLILHDSNGHYVAVVLAGDQRIDFNKVQTHVGAKKLKFVEHAEVLRVTGYPAGGTPPFGFAQAIPTLVDEAVIQQEFVLGGGGRPELLVKIAPANLVEAAGATIGDFSKR
jgi:Cys-tRNA(Pro)/Cys-tRNA(Cys) deacylase